MGGGTELPLLDNPGNGPLPPGTAAREPPHPKVSSRKEAARCRNSGGEWETGWSDWGPRDLPARAQNQVKIIQDCYSHPLPREGPLLLLLPPLHSSRPPSAAEGGGLWTDHEFKPRSAAYLPVVTGEQLTRLPRPPGRRDWEDYLPPHIEGRRRWLRAASWAAGPLIASPLPCPPSSWPLFPWSSRVRPARHLALQSYPYL